jgi:hypothetical protein
MTRFSNAIFAIMPWAALCLIAVVFDRLFRRRNLDAPRGVVVLAAAVAWGVAVTAVTEFLNLLRLLTHRGLVGAWATILCVLLALLLVTDRRADTFSEKKSADGNGPARPDGFALFFLGAAAVIVLLLGVIAVVAAPNNYDSMTYHLARVAHWAQNHSVRHYPTHIPRQLFMPPWAEFAILNFQLLSQSDRLANLVQWFAMLGCLLGVARIAASLGAGVVGQAYAAIVAATIPSGIAEATSTQNDYVAAFWLVCFVAFGLEWRDRRSAWPAVFAAGGLGLALLSKSTAVICAFPFACWFGASLIRRAPARQALRSLALAGVIVLAINAGHAARNVRLFGSPFASPAETRSYRNESFGPGVFAAALAKNLAIHFATTSATANQAVAGATATFARWLGVDPDDRRTNYNGARFGVGPARRQEDAAGAPLHLVLFAVAAGMLLFGGRERRNPAAAKFALACLAAYALFVLCLRWQPWPNKQLPLVVLAAAAWGAVMERLRAWQARATAAILLVAAIPFVFWNEARPLAGANNIFTVDRPTQYFANMKFMREPFVAMAKVVSDRGCNSLGLAWSDDVPEYPLWALTAARTPAVRIEHIGVRKATAAADWLDLADYHPCAVIQANGTQEFILRTAGSDDEWVFSLVPARQP